MLWWPCAHVLLCPVRLIKCFEQGCEAVRQAMHWHVCVWMGFCFAGGAWPVARSVAKAMLLSCVRILGVAALKKEIAAIIRTKRSSIMLSRFVISLWASLPCVIHILCQMIVFALS